MGGWPRHNETNESSVRAFRKQCGKRYLLLLLLLWKFGACVCERGQPGVVMHEAYVDGRSVANRTKRHWLSDDASNECYAYLWDQNYAAE